MDKELLFKPRLEEADVEIPGVGTVRVRALNRQEQLSIAKATDTLESIDGTRALAIERMLLAMALVEPEMTEDEVRRWQEASPAGELGPVVLTVQGLSGMLEGAAKAAYAAFRNGPGAGSGVPASGEASHDGGGTAGAYL